MPNFAEIKIIGHAGQDAELRVTQNGTQVASFTVAVKTRKDETIWYKVSCFGSTAEKYVAPYLKKGAAVFVSGQPNLEVFTKRDGSAGAAIAISANDVQILERKEGAQPTHQPARQAEQKPVDDFEDEIPWQ